MLGHIFKAILILGLHFTPVKCSAVKHIRGDILLSESYQTCQSVDLNQDRVICEIHSEEDENNLVCLGLSNCKMPVTLCPDGSINKTCFPLRDDNSLSYLCICHSKRRAESMIPVTEWTTWTTSTNPYQSFISERRLIVPSLDLTVSQEFSQYRTPTKVYIISHYNLPSSVYTASVTLGGHETYRAHFDFSGSGSYAWVGGGSTPWLQMTLPTQYVVVGTIIKQRCDSCCRNQYATRVKITTSVNGVSWETVTESEDVIYDVYNGPGKYSMWLPRASTNRYWRIQALLYSHHPSMKADLIGYK